MVVLIPRFARVVVPGILHQITHRGNRRDDVFFLQKIVMNIWRLCRIIAGGMALISGVIV